MLSDESIGDVEQLVLQPEDPRGGHLLHGESARGTPLRLTHGVCLTAPLSHVLALRLAGGFADRRAATAREVGGTSGTAVEIIPVYTVGEGRRTFEVRGFESASVYGTRAAAASLEYRAPFVRGGRG